MKEIYIYNSEKDEWNELHELTDVEFLSVAEEVKQEADRRVYNTLEPFEGEITGKLTGVDWLRFYLLFKDWSGYVPRRIGW